MQPITLDRSRLERYANCPMQGYLYTLAEALKTKAEGKEELYEWEKKMVAEADPELVKKLSEIAGLSKGSILCDSGDVIHKLIHKAFIECNQDIDLVPDWFLENLPKVRADIQPEVRRAARFVCDIIANLHVKVLSIEHQVDYCILPETKNRGAVVVTMRYDLICSGLNMSLHARDWKTGWKEWNNTETADTFQAECGAWLLWQQPEYSNIEIVHWWYHYTRSGHHSYARFDRKYEHPKLPDLTTEVAIKERIMTTVRSFLDGSKECWPEEQKCCWCDYIQFCPNAHMHAVEIDKDTTGYVDNLIVMQAYVKKLKKAAKEWVKGKGAIEGKKYILDKKPPSNKFTVDFQSKDKAKGPAKVGDPDLDKHFE